MERSLGVEEDASGKQFKVKTLLLMVFLSLMLIQGQSAKACNKYVCKYLWVFILMLDDVFICEIPCMLMMSIKKGHIG